MAGKRPPTHPWDPVKRKRGEKTLVYVRGQPITEGTFVTPLHDHRDSNGYGLFAGDDYVVESINILVGGNVWIHVRRVGHMRVSPSEYPLEIFKLVER